MFVKVNGIDGEPQYIHRNHVVSIAEYDNAKAEAEAQNRIEKAKVDPDFATIPQAQQDSFIAATQEEGSRYSAAKAIVTLSTDVSLAVEDTAEELMERFKSV